MTRDVVFLRGINVGRNMLIRMADLKAPFDTIMKLVALSPSFIGT